MHLALPFLSLKKLSAFCFVFVIYNQKGCVNTPLIHSVVNVNPCMRYFFSSRVCPALFPRQAAQSPHLRRARVARRLESCRGGAKRDLTPPSVESSRNKNGIKQNANWSWEPCIISHPNHSLERPLSPPRAHCCFSLLPPLKCPSPKGQGHRRLKLIYVYCKGGTTQCTGIINDLNTTMGQFLSHRAQCGMMSNAL